MAKKQGFTLVELLLVVGILGILAAIVIPQLSNAGDSARASMLADNIRAMRMQIMTFKWQHNGVAPGYPDLDVQQSPTEAAFSDHMTKSTTFQGAVADPGTAGYPLGPYMLKIPMNPVNGKTSVQIVADNQSMPATADDSHGWLYKPSSQRFKADCSGEDETDKAFIDF